MSERVENVRQLTEWEFFHYYEWDDYTVEEIRALIDRGAIKEEWVVAYYNNEWWEETP